MRQNYLFFLFLGLLAASCGHPDSFRIEGEIEGAPSMNLRVLYTGRDGVTATVTAAREGKFSFEGTSERPAVVQIFDNEYRVLGRTVAQNGEDVHLRLDRDNPYRISASGDPLGEAWAQWLNTRADSLRTATAAERNDIIARFVAANPTDPVSALLMITDFDSSGPRSARAAELWAAIAPEARPAYLTAGYEAQLSRVADAAARERIAAIPYMKRGGKTEIYRPASARLTLIAVTDAAGGRDSIVAALDRATRHRAKGRLEVLELSMAVDTMEWHRSVLADTVRWTQGWAAGGISGSAVGRLGIPSIPYFILADSAGRQLWRGAGASDAVSQTIQQLSCL